MERSEELCFQTISKGKWGHQLPATAVFGKSCKVMTPKSFSVDWIILIISTIISFGLEGLDLSLRTPFTKGVMSSFRIKLVLFKVPYVSTKLCIFDDSFFRLVSSEDDSIFKYSF